MDKDIYLKQIRKLILNSLKGQKFQIFLFGSQVSGRAGRASDIDIAILPITVFPRGVLSQIREELEESNIPYSVDLVDLSRSNPGFVQRVREEGVAWILDQIGITFRRHSKEDVFAGYYDGENRVVIVPRNKRSIPKGTLSSVWRQAGINREIAGKIWEKRNK